MYSEQDSLFFVFCFCLFLNPYSEIEEQSEAREEVEVDEEDPGLQHMVGALGKHVVMSEEVMVVKEAKVESVIQGQQGKV